MNRITLELLKVAVSNSIQQPMDSTGFPAKERLLRDANVNRFTRSIIKGANAANKMQQAKTPLGHTSQQMVATPTGAPVQPTTNLTSRLEPPASIKGPPANPSLYYKARQMENRALRQQAPVVEQFTPPGAIPGPAIPTKSTTGTQYKTPSSLDSLPDFRRNPPAGPTPPKTNLSVTHAPTKPAPRYLSQLAPQEEGQIAKYLQTAGITPNRAVHPSATPIPNKVPGATVANIPNRAPGAAPLQTGTTGAVDMHNARALATPPGRATPLAPGKVAAPAPLVPAAPALAGKQSLLTRAGKFAKKGLIGAALLGGGMLLGSNMTSQRQSQPQQNYF